MISAIQLLRRTGDDLERRAKERSLAGRGELIDASVRCHLLASQIEMLYKKTEELEQVRPPQLAAIRPLPLHSLHSV
jgi:hypothetical protein